MSLRISICLISVVLQISLLGCNSGPETSPKVPTAAEPAHIPVELAVYMGRMQVYTEKTWFAGKAKNWELASFYLHEIEEIIEEVEKAKVVEDGHDISTLITTSLSTPVRQLEEAIKTQDLPKFEERYPIVVRNCNNCHAATKHAFIQLKTPDRPAFSSQIFEPVAP
jgi:hypothetical protein